MRTRKRDIFTTIRTEGNLLPMDLLQRVAEGDRNLDGLTPETYHIGKAERLNEVINRAWKRCQTTWNAFQKEYQGLPDSDAGTTLTRERWLLVLFQELAYGRLLTSKAKEIDGKSYPISHFWNNTPIHLVSFRHNLDRRTPGVAGAARLSPHGLVQEFLNRSQEHLWGMVSNGLSLRLLRDNASLTRQAYVEFDLEGMMSGEVYSDFILFFLLLHQSRVEAEKPEQCWLEQWTRKAQEQGTRALDQLRRGVEEAIKSLGKGFLAHPANAAIRGRLRKGELDAYDLYQQLLRLIYRLIFLFVAEDRNLLLHRQAEGKVKRLYLNHYSLNRVRRMAGRIRGTRHADLWEGLRVTFRCLYQGEPALGIDPLGGFLFSPDAIPDLNHAGLSNESLLDAVRHLSYTQEGRSLRPVDYRNLGTEELGSVYESLLELHPEVNTAAATFDLRVAVGSDRKTTGSYYTPSSLINCLLDSALEPVIEDVIQKPDPEKALLDLKIVDPACGSGHFLIAGAHRMAKHLAMIRTGEAEPAPEERRKAIRDVVSHCIYGVDLNPLAVELCKVALWIETLDPGKPLGFLDHHIKCGNSLIGATPELLEKGIPDDAFKPVEGDDKKAATAIRKKNREERKWKQKNLFAEQATAPGLEETIEEFREWGFMPEDNQQAVSDKAALYQTLMDDPGIRHAKEVANLWTSAFFWPLTDASAASVPTEDRFRRFQEGSLELPDPMRKRMESLFHKHRFFHWHLEFPEVFGDEGGFDCVLGNPPWERIKLQEKEFFAQRDPEIANAPNAATRKKLIFKLPEGNPALWGDFQETKRGAEAESHYMRASNRYPLSAVGDINTYQIFAGLDRELASDKGRVGIVIPSGIATDDSNKQFFADLTEKKSLVSLYDFENREAIFPGVHRSYKFCLLTIGGSGTAPRGADFAFFLTNTSQLGEEDRHFSLSAEDIALLNPNTRTCPIFRSKRDAEITKDIYRRVPVLIDQRERKETNSWGIEFSEMFHMTNDAGHFHVETEFEGAESLGPYEYRLRTKYFTPLYEGKMTTLWDSRFASVVVNLANPFRSAGAKKTSILEKKNPFFFVRPRYWVEVSKKESRIPEVYSLSWFCVFQKVTSPTNERTLIVSIVPRVATGASIPVIFVTKVAAKLVACFYANLASYILDYLMRQKIGGINVAFFLMKQLPVVEPQTYSDSELKFILKRVIELSYTAWDLSEFADDCGYSSAPFLWDMERRFLIKCEIDSMYFHLYGINRDDVDYIMETFSIVKRKDEQKYGEYRTKRIILRCYDSMAEAMKTGRPYQTILDPPPGPPAEGLPEWRPGQPKPKAWPPHIHPPKEVFNSV
ncbi:MAG: N-6 DNA methylase [Pseudomonadota bacterium]